MSIDGERGVILDSVVREVFMKEIIFKQRPELSEEASCAESLGKSILSRGNSKYKSSEVGLVQCVQRTSKKASMGGVELCSFSNPSRL